MLNTLTFFFSSFHQYVLGVGFIVQGCWFFLPSRTSQADGRRMCNHTAETQSFKSNFTGEGSNFMRERRGGSLTHAWGMRRGEGVRVQESLSWGQAGGV